MNKAKAYLIEISKLRLTAETLGNRVEQLRTQASGMKGISYDRDRVQGGTGNNMEDAVIDLAPLEVKYKKALIEYHEAVLTRTKQISAMDNSTYAKILLLRYVEEKKLDEIADELNYTYQYIRLMHGRALDAFRERYLSTLCNKE